MSVEAPGLLPLVSYLKQTLGVRRYGGVVGDGEHLYGYHLGKDRIFSPAGLGWDDYSISTPRDKGSLNDYACAIDVGCDWRLHSDWLLWLVTACRQGRYPDIREIIGTLDGERVVGWDAENHWITEPDRGDFTHLWHTHISFYRDSAWRDQTYVLKDFFDPPPKAAPVVTAKPSPVVVEARPIERWGRAPMRAPEPRDPDWMSLYPMSGLLTVGAMAWLLRRRMELAREDS